MVKTLDRMMERAGCVCIAVTVLASPWMFGAWEMWWFWPFATLVFVAGALFGCRVTMAGGPWSVVRGLWFKSVLLGYAGFLVYAWVRFLQADVYMDAERGFLLFLTPFLLGLAVIFGIGPGCRRVLLALLVVDFFALGVYGVTNHFAFGSARVMWVEGFPQYIEERRATGSYFCPDHFAGIMELAFCMAVALVMDRRSTRAWRMGGLGLAALSVAGVLLSKSRGGGLTLVVVGLAAVGWGFSQWPASVRRYLRGAVLLAAAAGMVAFWSVESEYMRRFHRYFGWERMEGKPLAEQRELLTRRMLQTSRGRMIAGAIRAWKTDPVFGIGPGMHQNLWPHFAASDDGDREKGIWPSMPNHDFHSYEVHSDWVQLLEEYGVVGFTLFLVPFGALFLALIAGRPREEEEEGAPLDVCAPLHAAPLTALLAFLAMAFHSLGDFNLQMPATVWVLAAILALGLTGPRSVAVVARASRQA